ncbi:PREDICTED: nose resistant to fluoxetine protein 6-like isoform X2 [Papilio xuthus]|nr:PREDICTED: nose resistant to fluoxetine protein 6-like isoform X2 [Papilio xuthus]
MVRLRWTFTLIIIPVILFATVITAFRIRDLQKSSHESVSEFKKKPKCEECEVNKLDLDHKLHIYKAESVKRPNDDLNKPIQGKKKHIEEKTSDKIKPVLEEIEDESEEDEDDENLIYLRNLASKWEEKQKASNLKSEKESTKIINKRKDTAVKDNFIKNTIKVDRKTDSENEDDDDDDDDDDSIQKTTGVIKKKSTSVRIDFINDDEEGDDGDDEDNDSNDSGFINTKVELKDKLSKVGLSSREVETPLKQVKISKSGVKDKALPKEIKTAHSLTSEIKKEDRSNIAEKKAKEKVVLKEKNKETVVVEKVLKDVKIKKSSTEEVVDKEEDRKVQKQEPFQTDEIKTHKVIKEVTKDTKPTIDVKNKKNKDQIKPEAVSKEMPFNDCKIESQEDSRLKHITESLHRRNLLKSEFADFYAFLPTFAPNFTRVQNPECRRHGQILLRQLRGAKLWALSMLDATAKVPSGILHGNGIQLGSFDQCLGSRARVQLDTGSIVKVHGKYCLARVDLKSEHQEMEIPVHLAQSKNLIKSRIDDPGHFVPRFSTLSWGVCVPAPCSPEDVENIVRDAIKHYQYTSGVSIRVRVDEQDCHVQKKQAWWEDWLGIPTLVTLFLYGVVLLLVLVATAQDFAARRKDEETNGKAEDEGDKKGAKDTQVKKTEGENAISVFSLYRTVRKLMAPATTDEISCIHGVRAIATVALLIAHKFLPVASTPYTNRLMITEVVSSPLWSWCRAGWMYTDCFLLLSGTLTAHRIANDNESGAFKRILFRYLRLTPALLAVILFYAYIWDNISVGPMWGSLVTKNAEVCQQGWWWNVFYLQNYFGFEDMCAPQTHQLALDMQLSVLGGVVVWAMQSELPMLRALLPTLHVWTAFSRYRTTKEHRLTLLAYHGVSVSQLYRTARLSYTSVIHRASPYLLGLSLGLALKNNTRHSKILLAFGWLISGALWCSVWWAGFDSGSTQYRYSSTFAAQYAALAPIASALAIAWLIYAVHGGHCD